MTEVVGVAWVVSWVTVGRLIRLGGDWALDLPNHRSLHHQPVPRIGGLGLLAGFVAALAMAPEGAPPAAVLLGLSLLAVVSLIDDLSGLPAAWRLLAQIVAVGLALHGLGAPLSHWWWLLPFGVWCVNLYNFMDGADGLAGGMAVSGFGALGAAAWMWGDGRAALPYWSLSAAALGFLAWNRPPARIFLGDVGSTSLGYLAFALSAQGIGRGWFMPWLPLIAFAPFLLDSSATLLRRLLRGERFWEPHRQHLYQRIVARGGSHVVLLRLAWPLMLTCALLALGFEWLWRGGWSGLAVALLAAVCVALALLYTALIRKAIDGAS